MLAKLKSTAPAAFLLFALAVNVYGYHTMFRAYSEEKEHAEWLYGCTQFQRPADCENDWQRQYQHHAPPWGF